MAPLVATARRAYCRGYAPKNETLDMEVARPNNVVPRTPSISAPLGHGLDPYPRQAHSTRSFRACGGSHREASCSDRTI